MSSTDDLDELEQARNRPTPPAPPMTDRQMLESMFELLSGLAADVRAIAANQTIATDEGRSFNRRVSDLEDRVSRLESHQLNGGSDAAQ